MGLITRLSGLLKTITYTILVMCRVNFKTVRMCKSFVVQALIRPYRQGRTVNLFPQTLNLTLIWDIRFAGYFPVHRHKTLGGAECLSYNENPYYIWSLLPATNFIQFLIILLVSDIYQETQVFVSPL
jgi:hypothetical protein